MAGNERNIKVRIDHVEKIYEGRKGRMIALNGIDLDIMENEFICVVGPSGCGKSTLLNIISCNLRCHLCGRQEGGGHRDGTRSSFSAVCPLSMVDRIKKCYVWP